MFWHWGHGPLPSGGATGLTLLAPSGTHSKPGCALFDRIYAPLTAGLLQPVRSKTPLQHERLSQLDTLYQHVVEALDRLLQGVGLKAA